MSAPRGADVVATWAEAEREPRPPLLVLEPLAAFLDAHGIGAGPLAVHPLGEGHSNVTYAVAREGARVVVRRPPRPPLPPSAHDVLREARIQQALRSAGVRVPRILAVCEDERVLGAPFYVMERLDGEVLGAALPAGLDTPARRAAVGHELVDALAELHAVDAAAAGLGALARADGYLERQLRRFAGLLEANATRELPEMEQIAGWLREHRPRTSATTVVHGDYRLGNAMFALGDRVELAAILDWEMATLGDPLADVGYLSAMWADPADEQTPTLALSAITRLDGFCRRADLLERYSARTGRSLEQIRWYEVLALWKAAVFLECSYARHLQGTTDDPYFATLDTGVPAVCRAATQLILAT